ncbi:hypothetical protein CTAYLR_008776 [Chrysophaeum taylorii]|uniref:Methyltransferase type 11 domain-containing protein n=1 Tax=Chrysophaeum taylorii TaxID=2483200 RepID=A0AAD7UEN0_9STRA|nr:hypothetical protein CTAYLR_008776 [Chrysophaeum taylorii]
MRSARWLGVKDVLAAPRWPAEWPYSSVDFSRQDETNDSDFYSFPRFCYHIDERAVGALTAYYDKVFGEWQEPAVLDLCASHVSHYPRDSKRSRTAALGMNEVELRENKDVEEWVVQDLNENPSLPFGDAEFDIVTNAVSVDYLTRPLEVCREVERVLKPGGAALFALSNRCFPSKAIQIWLRTNDLEHVFIAGSFFHYAGGFEPPTAAEISPTARPWIGGTSQNECYLAVVRANKKK